MNAGPFPEFDPTAASGSTSAWNCAEINERVTAFLDQELEDPAQHEWIRSHLDQCPPCLDEAQLEAVVKKLVKRACCETAPDHMRGKVMATLMTVRGQAVTEQKPTM